MTVLRVAVEIARAIDLVTREIATQELAEIALGVETLEAVPEIGAASETVPDTAAEVPEQAAAEAPQAWAVRAEAAAELVAEAAAVGAVVGGRDTTSNRTRRQLLANAAKHFAFTRCAELNLYGIVDAQLPLVEGKLLADDSLTS